MLVDRGVHDVHEQVNQIAACDRISVAGSSGADSQCDFLVGARANLGRPRKAPMWHVDDRGQVQAYPFRHVDDRGALGTRGSVVGVPTRDGVLDDLDLDVPPLDIPAQDVHAQDVHAQDVPAQHVPAQFALGVFERIARSQQRQTLTLFMVLRVQSVKSYLVVASVHAGPLSHVP